LSLTPHPTQYRSFQKRRETLGNAANDNLTHVTIDRAVSFEND